MLTTFEDAVKHPGLKWQIRNHRAEIRVMPAGTATGRRPGALLESNLIAEFLNPSIFVPCRSKLPLAIFWLDPRLLALSLTQRPLRRKENKKDHASHRAREITEKSLF
jgi:hypothetical protein